MTAAARLLLLLSILAASAAPAVAVEAWNDVLREPAAHLWSPLPPGSRIAVRPLQGDESGLPDSLLREAERALTAALLATAPPGGEVAARRDLQAAWEEAESFGDASARRLLADAAVDAVAVTSLTERRGGVALSGVLLAVRDGAVGDVLATLAPTDLSVDLSRFDLASAETGARRIGVALAEGLRTAADPTAAFAVRVRQAGRRSPVADWFAGLVREHLIRRLATAPLYISRPLRRLGEGAETRTVLLSLDVWDQGVRVDVQVRAAMDGVETHVTARVALASIPSGFLPLTRDGGRVGRGFYQSVGEFAPDGRTDRREVLFAARVLARAALIDDALGQGDGFRQGSRRADVASAMVRLGLGVPHEEIWRDRPASGAAAVQDLRARLAPVGGGDAPRLEAAVERGLYRAGEALGVRVLVRGGRAYIAAYAWQADDTVVRIAPRGTAARRLEPETRADLPGPGDPEIAPAPLSGSDETVEAIVVVASALPFAADALAPSAAGTPGESLAGAAEMSAFLDALATLDLSRTSLAVLPYRVRSAD